MHKLTNKERDQTLTLILNRFSTTAIMDYMHISASTINYLKQAYNAAKNNDLETLSKLYNNKQTATVLWAMSLFGISKDMLDKTKVVESSVNTQITDTDDLSYKLSKIIELLETISNQLK